MLHDSYTNTSGDSACNCDAGYSRDGTVGNRNDIDKCDTDANNCIIKLVHSSVHVLLVIMVMMLYVSTFTNAPNSHTVVMQMPNVQTKFFLIVCVIVATVQMTFTVSKLKSII